uniref:Apple domain-containing protein n=1 Tax=Meloidogyne hapla TaxID=6305 RepID=A0A1I8BCA3_MELHA
MMDDRKYCLEECLLDKRTCRLFEYSSYYYSTIGAKISKPFIGQLISNINIDHYENIFNLKNDLLNRCGNRHIAFILIKDAEMSIFNIVKGYNLLLPDCLKKCLELFICSSVQYKQGECIFGMEELNKEEILPLDESLLFEPICLPDPPNNLTILDCLEEHVFEKVLNMELRTENIEDLIIKEIPNLKLEECLDKCILDEYCLSFNYRFGIKNTNISSFSPSICQILPFNRNDKNKTLSVLIQGVDYYELACKREKIKENKEIITLEISTIKNNNDNKIKCLFLPNSGIQKCNNNEIITTQIIIPTLITQFNNSKLTTISNQITTTPLNIFTTKKQIIDQTNLNKKINCSINADLIENGYTLRLENVHQHHINVKQIEYCLNICIQAMAINCSIFAYNQKSKDCLLSGITKINKENILEISQKNENFNLFIIKYNCVNNNEEEIKEINIINLKEEIKEQKIINLIKDENNNDSTKLNKTKKINSTLLLNENKENLLSKDQTNSEIKNLYLNQINVSVFCDSQGANVSFKLKNDSQFYSGKIYAKDSFDNCLLNVKNAKEFFFFVNKPINGNNLIKNWCNAKITNDQLNVLLILSNNMGEGIPPEITTKDDLFFYITCRYINGIPIPVGNVKNEVETFSELQTKQQLFKKHLDEQNLGNRKDNRIKLKILKNGKPISNVFIGEKLLAIVESNNDIIKQNFRVSECNATRILKINEGKEQNRNKIIPLLDSNGCSLHPQIMGNMHRVDDHLEAEFIAFRIDGGSELDIICSVIICRDNCKTEKCISKDNLEESSIFIENPKEFLNFGGTSHHRLERMAMEQQKEKINENDKITVDKRIRVLAMKEMDIPIPNKLIKENNEEKEEEDEEKEEEEEEMDWILKENPLNDKILPNKDNSIDLSNNNKFVNTQQDYAIINYNENDEENGCIIEPFIILLSIAILLILSGAVFATIIINWLSKRRRDKYINSKRNYFYSSK